jgi:elongation factor Ts
MRKDELTMAITSAQIKELRERTGAGMMDCKKALTENDGNTDAAIDWLRKKGLAAAAKKAGRTAAEGLVAVKTDGKQGVAIELNAETDFVARNDQFQALAKEIADVALTKGGDFEATKAEVESKVTAAVGSIGENMTFRRADGLSVDQGVVTSYMHNAVTEGLGKIGILVAVESTGDAAKLEAFGKQLAMHVAAARPESLDETNLDQALVEKERQIFAEQAKASGKPDNIIEKMVEGRIKKFYGEVCLLDQVYVIDGKAKVREAIAEAEKEVGAPIKVAGFVRFQLGDGVEKEEDNFAEEVAKAAAGA